LARQRRPTDLKEMASPRPPGCRKFSFLGAAAQAYMVRHDRTGARDLQNYPQQQQQQQQQQQRKTGWLRIQVVGRRPKGRRA